MAKTVSGLYADVLLEIAKEDGSGETLEQELFVLGELIGDNPELVAAMTAPTISNAEKAQILGNIFGGRISQTTLNFLCVLAEKNRFGYLKAIADKYREGYYEMCGISEVTVTTAVPLKPAAREKLMRKLEKMYKGRIILRERVDSSILGGMVISCRDSCIDGSVKAELGRIHRQIRDVIA